MFIPFICLSLPEDAPFWTAKENEGFWCGLGIDTNIEVLNNPGLVLANHGKTGTTEIITGKVYYDDQNYSKLSFNTHFPWEAHDPKGGTSMEYSFRSLDLRDVRGDDINFYLTGLAIGNSAGLNSVFTTSQSMLFNGSRLILQTSTDIAPADPVRTTPVQIGFSETNRVLFWTLLTKHHDILCIIAIIP